MIGVGRLDIVQSTGYIHDHFHVGMTTLSRLYAVSVAMSTYDLLIASQSLNGWPSTDRLLDPVDLKLLTAAHSRQMW